MYKAAQSKILVCQNSKNDVILLLFLCLKIVIHKDS